MKKNLIVFLFVCIVTSLFSCVEAVDLSLTIPKVFKVYSYSYNPSFGNYKAEGFGSAVLVDTNKVLTNAHVIADSNGTIRGYYELCKSNGLKEKTTCFSALRVLRYDPDNDLALLEVEKATDLGTPVSLGSGELTIGMNINVIGFPANGGESVTVTKGTIAGYEKGFYKIDANLDGGNSGGGGFDDNGNLIGIPTFVSQGYTTLGYIIPIETVKKFIGGELGKTVTTSVRTSFLSYLDSLYSFESGGIISNANFTTPNINDYDLKMKYINEKKDKGFYDYDLSTTDESVGISLRIVQFSAKMSAREYANLQVYQVRKNGGTTSVITKTGANNTKWFIVYDAQNKEYMYIQANSQNNVALIADVTDETKEGASKTALQNAVGFVEQMVIKPSYQKNKALPLPQITLSGTNNFLFTKSYSEEGLNVVFYPTNKRFIGMIGYYTINVTADDMQNLQDVLTSIASTWGSLYKAAGYTIKNAGIIKNDQGESIILMQILDQDNNAIMLAHMVVKDAGNYLMPIVEFHYYSPKDESYIKNYIKSIRITNPIK